MNTKAIRANIDEVFNSVQGEGPYVGTRQVFVRFCGCPLTCVYCDSLRALTLGDAQSGPEGSITRSFASPISVADLVKLLERLWTPATEHISLTGGEPLLHTDFIAELACSFEKPLYLETNGMLSRAAERIKNLISVAACDVKLLEHKSARTYDMLLREELRSIKVFYESNVNVFVKIVITTNTEQSVLAPIAQRLARIDPDIPLVLQPVTPRSKAAKPSNELLFALMDTAGTYLNHVRAIPQVHRMLKIL